MKNSASRRTTLTLPSAYLETAERIAKERHLNLSSVIAEALQRGLREEEQTQRSKAVLQAYSKAFTGFTAKELLMLDGILVEEHTLEEVAPEKPQISKVERRGRK